ncbi:MAG: MFS transporter [Deltaproteobacteria bacterium]|nr:MFS transporter [Deltaproteobacteria bacterium]
MSAPAADRTAPPSYSPGYLRYALGLLTVVYVINFVDRQILSILLQSIKLDLGLHDWQLGLLSGTAFGIFYATLGVPIARLADVFSRRGVIAICLAIWSGMTALCGTAGGFALLLTYRVGVGIGEAGGSPPAHSLISDYFAPERRATALGIFSLGVPLGILVGFMAGGWMDETLGWRMAFKVVGLPGLLLAVLVALTLKEPPRGHSEGIASEGDAPSALTVIGFLWRSHSFRHIAIGSGLYAFVGYSVVTWAPSFLIRSHGMATGEIGTWLALIFGIGGGLGTVGGGLMADRWAATDLRGRAWVPAIAMFAALPFSFVIYTTENTTLALVTLCAPSVFGLMYQAPAFAITQSLATPLMRATAAAVLLFVINIIGLALGPVTTGALSDVLTPRFGDDSLGYALLIVSCTLAWAGVHFLLGARTLAADVEYVRRASEQTETG